MSDSTTPYFYDKQLYNYILQFMAIFSDLHVMFGAKDDREPGLVPVHLTYGHKDRVVAHIKSNNTQNKPIRLPALSVNFAGIEQARERYKGQQTNRRYTYLERGGVMPDDIKTNDQLMPIPYDLNMEASFYTTNLDEHFQILEQLLVLFDPDLILQKSEDPHDWTKMYSVELVNIIDEKNYPSGQDRRILQTNMNFVCRVWLGVPQKTRNDYIKSIMMRVGTVANSSSGSFDMIQQLDEQQISYNSLFDFDTDNEGLE